MIKGLTGHVAGLIAFYILIEFTGTGHKIHDKLQTVYSSYVANKRLECAHRYIDDVIASNPGLRSKPNRLSTVLWDGIDKYEKCTLDGKSLIHAMYQKSRYYLKQ